MTSTWTRLRKQCLALSTGGITLGIFQGFGLVNFASLFASLLGAWLSTIVAILLGADPSKLLA